MGKLGYGMMVSLDGFVAGPNGDLNWHIVEEELHNLARALTEPLPTPVPAMRSSGIAGDGRH
jgi:hypothetical protein